MEEHIHVTLRLMNGVLKSQDKEFDEISKTDTKGIYRSFKICNPNRECKWFNLCRGGCRRTGPLLMVNQH